MNQLIVLLVDTDTIRIGKPFPGVDTYILGSDLQPVATGDEGELWLGGVQLSGGYWGMETLTKEKFPLIQVQPGNVPTRLYRTGGIHYLFLLYFLLLLSELDIVRQHSDGNIEYINRTDFQVKVRGYRIEIKEIEAVVEMLSAITRAVVVSLLRIF